MRYFIFSILFLIISKNYSQNIDRWSSTKIYNEIEKLNFLGSVVYIAAHPDDENTNLISYLSNQEKATTSYISLTRGDGGQNLIGNELRESLGVIRTQELLEARKIDGGHQYFTRANDFGFSKSPEETLNIWNKEQVLYDITYLIRTLQPDVIINRFDHRTPGTTHGHHTSSAILMQDVFKNAANPNYFPKQLQELNLWQPKKLFFNLSSFFYKNQKDFDSASKKEFLKIYTGNYYSNLGISNSEIAAWSRSKHRSQGFGTLSSRGEFIEYLEPIVDLKSKSESIFDGINTSWSRLKGAAPLDLEIKDILKKFNFNNPSESLPKLINVYQTINSLENSYWKNKKLEDLKRIIVQCSGLYIDFHTIKNYSTPGSSVDIFAEIISQNTNNIIINNLTYVPTNFKLSNRFILEKNIPFKDIFTIEIKNSEKYTNTQWVNNNASIGMYFYENDSWLKTPDVIRNQNIKVDIEILNQIFSLEYPIFCKTNNPSFGESRQPFDILPQISLYFTNEHAITKDLKPYKAKLKIESFKNVENIKVELTKSNDYSIFPESILIDHLNENQSKEVEFTITPNYNGDFKIMANAFINDKTFNQKVITISYPHIYNQRVLKTCELNFHALNLNSSDKKIAYIMGAGDEVWKGLKEIGYQVDILKPQEINYQTLKKYDCLILGIRAYNVLKELEYKNSDILQYIEEGGNVVSQYNTTNQLNFKKFSPYDLSISSDRITDENAEIIFLNKNHRALNFPNKITTKDFKGWIQEQGLYYPSKWDEKFTPLLRSKDPNQDYTDGALLISKFGKGHYIYTGLSFFRQIPNGVKGAYKLLINLIEINDKDESRK